MCVASVDASDFRPLVKNKIIQKNNVTCSVNLLAFRRPVKVEESAPSFSALLMEPLFYRVVGLRAENCTFATFIQFTSSEEDEVVRQAAGASFGR